MCKVLNNNKPTKMKKLFLFFLSTLLCSGSLNAQRQSVPQQTLVSHNEINKNDSILKELQIIRGIQVEAKQKIDSIRNARKNHATPPDEKAEEDLSNEYEAMTRIADNTRQDWVKDDWNAYGWVAFFIALFSLGVSGVTLWAQWQTEKNTSKLSREEQKALLSDMIRHFYRNYVVSLTLRVKLQAGKKSKTKDGKNKNFSGYPSEEHIKKLMVNLNDVHLNLFYKEEESHQLMNKLYVMLRNYNLELDVICDHLKSQSIDYATKSRDLDTLAFKCFYLTKEITRLIGNIWYGNEMSYVLQAKERIIKEQEKNRKDNPDETKHYGRRIKLNVPAKSYYLETLFADDPKSFLENLKKDIQIEAGLNTGGSPKIHIIKCQE